MATKSNVNFWSKLLEQNTPVPGAPAPAPAPDPTPDPTSQGLLHKLGSMLSLHHGVTSEPTPQPNAESYGPRAPGRGARVSKEGLLEKLGSMLTIHHEAAEAPGAAQAVGIPSANAPADPGTGFLHKLGDVLSLRHDGSAPSAPAEEAPPAHKVLPSSRARAGRAVIPPPQAPGKKAPADASQANLAAVSRQDMPTVGVPPIDATALPNPGTLAARLGDQLPMVAPRSGQKREGEATEEVHQDDKSTRTSWASGDQMKQITDSILSLPMIQDQMKQNQLHKQLLALTSNSMPYRLDLSPLAAIADSWVQNAKAGNKSNLEGAALAQYKNRADRRNGLEQSLRDLDTSQNQLSGTVLKAAQDFKNGQDTKDAYSKLSETAKASNSDPMGRFNPLTAMSTFDHLIERGMNTQKDQEASTEIRHLQDMLHSGNAVTDRNFPLLLAKVVAGSGRIAAYEVAREAGSPEISRQFDQLWSTLATGRITPENMGDYAHFVDLLAHNHNLMRGIQARRFSKIGQDYVPQDHVDAALPGSFVYDVPEHVGPKGSGGHGQVKPSIDALVQKYLQDRSKGGK